MARRQDRKVIKIEAAHGSDRQTFIIKRNYDLRVRDVQEDASKVCNMYLDKRGKKYTCDIWGNKEYVDDSLSPITAEEDEPPPPTPLKLKKSLSDEEMKEQLGKIKTLSNEYKLGGYARYATLKYEDVVCVNGTPRP